MMRQGVVASAAQILADVPNPAPVQPPGTQGLITIVGWAKWAALAALVVMLIITGLYFSWKSRRGDGGEGVGAIGAVLIGAVIVSASGTLVGFLAGQ
ncbi:hypothetical protein [Bifidobacterium xylocopae]|nr:hypothetical protein [Bifidobacterium xylocopae]